MTDIQYPEAFETPYRRVHVSALSRYDRGGPYYCYGCDQEMVVRLGEVNAHHFAHKSQQTTKCDPENALHRAAQANILEGFSEAVEKREPYHAGFQCASQHCANAVKFNIATSGSRIAAEKSAVQGTRADLVVYCPDDNGTSQVRLIIEVVVTHDLEASTLAKYQAAKVPVIKINPSWDSLEQLRNTVVAYDTVNVPTVECADCLAVREQEETQKREYEDKRRREQPAREAIRLKYERAQEEERKLREAEKLKNQDKRTAEGEAPAEEKPISAPELYTPEERTRAKLIREEEQKIEEMLQISDDTPLATKLRLLLKAQQDGTVWRKDNPT